MVADATVPCSAMAVTGFPGGTSIAGIRADRGPVLAGPVLAGPALVDRWRGRPVEAGCGSREPSLGWRQLDKAVRTRQQREFALGVESALDRLGLGPLSHRRP